MKILFFTDAHVGHYREFDKAGSRLNRCLDAVQYVLHWALDNGIDAIVEGGDLIDRKNMVDFTAYNKLYRMLEDYWNLTGDWLPPIHCLVGNHNMATYDGVETNLTPLAQFVRIHSEPRVVDFDECAIAFMPFRRRIEQWMEDWHNLSKQVQGLNKPVVCMAHQEVKGAVTGTHRYIAQGGIEPAVLPGPFDYVVFGHYHKYQQVANRSWYLGALLQQDFGEEGNPQLFWVFDTEAMTWESHTVPVPAFFTVEDPREIADETNFYRLRTSGDVELTPEQRGNVRVDIRPDEQTASILSSGVRGFSEMCEEWINAKCPPELQSNVRAVVNHLRQG